MTLALDRPLTSTTPTSSTATSRAGHLDDWHPGAADAGRRRHARPAGHRRARPLRQPRPRGERAGAAGRRRPRRGACCRYCSSVHRGAGLPSQVSTACWSAPASTSASSSGRARRRRRRVHPQHHRRAEPAGRGPSRGRCCASTSSTTPTCCRGGPAPPHAAPPRRRSPQTLHDLRRRPARHADGAAHRHRRVQRHRRGAAARRIAALAHAAGARVAVDAAQLAPHRRIDLAATGVDYVARVRAQALRALRRRRPGRPPRLARRRRPVPRRRRRGRRRSDRDGAAAGSRAPHRHEGGTPNVLGVAALAAGLPHARAGARPGRGPGARARAARPARRRARTVPGVTPLRIWPDSDATGWRCSRFTVAGHPAGSVAAYLSAEHGIGVRDGRFCAHPLLARLCAADGRTGTRVRASIGLGTTAEHVDRLVAALHAGHPRRGWTYAPVGGRWTPTPDPRELDPLGLGAGRTGAGPGLRSRRAGYPPHGEGVAQQHPAAAVVVVDQHRLGDVAHQRDAAPAAHVRLARRAPVPVVDDLDRQRGSAPRPRSVHSVSSTTPDSSGPVGVPHGVRGRLVDGQHDVGGLVLGQPSGASQPPARGGSPPAARGRRASCGGRTRCGPVP